MARAVSITTHPRKTAARRRRLEKYMRAKVLDGDDFICSSGPACKASATKPGVSYFEGQLSYVGRHFDTTVDARELRVLVVGMDAGHEPAHVTLDERERQVHARIADTFSQRNPHMRGVTLALQVAFGLPFDPPGAVEELTTSQGPVHVLDAYAMANLVLCSAVATGTKKSKATPVMRRNCARHLAATVEALEPTLVISQGGPIESQLRAVFSLDGRLGERGWHASANGVSFAWVPLSHPTSWDKPGQPPSRWDNPTRPYFRDVVVPGITAARNAQPRTAT